LQRASLEADDTALTPVDEPGETAADADVTQEPEPARATGGIGRSLRPRLRPDVSQAVAVAVAAASADRSASAAAEVDAATIPAGTRLAQLGAFASREIAVEEWDRLADRFDEYLADKDRVIQKASSGGRTFYRLRALGFEDLSDARRFCSALVAERAECIPVVTR